nr:hypothetical protein [Tanacetum cinerariifolium]
MEIEESKDLSSLALDELIENLKTQEEVAAMDAEPQGRINQEKVNAASKGVNAAEPTMFDDEEVTMTMA